METETIEEAEAVTGAAEVMLADEVPDAGVAEEEEQPEKSVEALEKEYAFDAVEGIDKNLADNFDADFAKQAKESGVSLEAATVLREKMLKNLSDLGKKRTAEIAAYNAEQEKKLRSEWKGQYDQKRQGIIALIEKIDGAPDGDFKRFIEGTKLSNDPRFMLNMSKITEVIAEDKKLYGEKGYSQKEESIEDYILNKASS